MTAPLGGVDEVADLTLAFQVALAKIGVQTVQAALAMWRRVPPTKAAEVADDWLNDAVDMVLTHRGQSRDLALAYYRLARAMRTGTTIPDPRNPIPKTVTLTELRAEFTRLVEAVDKPSHSPSDGSPAQDPSRNIRDEVSVPVEPISGLNEDGDKYEETLSSDAEQEAKIVLRALGTDSLKKRVSKIDDSGPATVVDQKREEAHSASGARQAAAAARVAMNGARHTTAGLRDRDKRVIGYVRVSTTGTPCGWCAMLISRGPIFYSSEASAMGKTLSAASVKRGDAAVGDEYHDNCNCIAIEVYAQSEYENSPSYSLNREYDALWPEVTKGLSGKAALSAWRKYFRDQQKQDKTTTSAQAA